MAKKTKIISILNQKGGVGKTTTTINLATAMVSFDKKILIVDLDPKAMHQLDWVLIIKKEKIIYIKL